MSGSVTQSNKSIPPAGLSTRFDVIIVGAGVVGCAMARRFMLEGARVLIVEKSGDILDGASKANSAILHTGFDAKPGSLEQACIESGYHEYLAIHEQFGLPIETTGALVVAWTEQDLARLGAILKRARQNGVREVKRLSAKQLDKQEQQLAKTALGAVAVAGESIIDPWTTPHAYLLQAIENGTVLALSAEVTGAAFDGAQWRLESSRGLLHGKLVINCAGLYGDHLERMILGKTDFEIRPRKGQFLVFDKSASKLVNSIILAVPDEMTKGIVVCPTIFGNLLVGPTAEEQPERDDASVDRDHLKMLYQRGLEIIPELAKHDVIATYAGIRPATKSSDYCISAHDEKNYICVAGIRSTGLSAALGIAKYVYGLYTNMGNSHNGQAPLNYPRLNSIAERAERDWRKPGNRGIVCHCELVTRREIEDALKGPLAATSLAALKRRTRATMGRCQGFYCLAQLSEITAQYFELPIGIDDAR